VIALLGLGLGPPQVRARASAIDPLPSWSNNATKRIIMGFVGRVTNATGKEFVPVADRIAVFDNDGTLWCEQPMYVEVVYSFARVATLLDAHPELRNREPYKMVVDRDTQALMANGNKRLGEVMVATHSGMTTSQFDSSVSDWLAKARHPRFNRPYTELAYQPMLELLEYLRANGFKTFVVSGGGADFMRVWATGVYGTPPDQVIGSTGRLAFELRDGNAELRKLAAIDLVDDGPGKPVGIHQYIGQQPILAFGNSDGDLQMLQYTDEGSKSSPGPHPRMMLLLHHDDAVREYAYDRNSKVGRLDKALDAARERGWTVVSMQADWRTVFKSP
jgi:hypothetical protein